MKKYNLVLMISCLLLIAYLIIRFTVTSNRFWINILFFVLFTILIIFQWITKSRFTPYEIGLDEDEKRMKKMGLTYLIPQSTVAFLSVVNK